ncbi:MAG: 30S ribosomal protein S9 [Parcubacteria group bacterium]|nr:30S ribosomal protein S9 [Parcubacteria group bacterium]
MTEKQEQPKNANPFAGRKYTTGTGRRKAAIANVKVYAKGRGEFVVNHEKFSKHFSYMRLADIARAALRETGKDDSVDVSARVTGGGPVGQAEAVRLGIARALVAMDEGLKPALRKAGFLTVDSRVKERKKPGLKRARRAPQWSKR